MQSIHENSMQILNFTCNCRRHICEHWTGTNKITWRLISCSQRKTRALIIWLMKLTTYLNIKKYKFHVNSFWCKNTSIQNGIARRNVKMYDIFIWPWLSYLRFYKKGFNALKSNHNYTFGIFRMSHVKQTKMRLLGDKNNNLNQWKILMLWNEIKYFL